MERTLICVYCGKQTTGNEDLEHIIPESLGAKDTLYRGAVCIKCNHDLGTKVDGKVFFEPMMAMGQVASGAEGKRGARKQIHSGKGIICKTDTGVSLTGGDCGKPNEQIVSRFLAKIAVNVLTDVFDSEYVRHKYPDLIRFVKMPKNKKEIWPFVSTYTTLKPISIFAPHSAYGPTFYKSIEPNFIKLICASGFFAIPLNRESSYDITIARAYIDNLIKDQEAQGSKFGTMMGYEAKNN